MTTKEREQKLLEARVALQNATSTRDAKEFVLLAEAKKAIAIQLDEEFGDGIWAARAVAEAAKSAYEDAVEADGKAGIGAKYKPGTVMEEWSRGRWGNTSLSRTGVRGVMEVVTRESVHPENLASYSLPALGSYIIRITKKDGTMSRRYVKSYRGDFPDWLPKEASEVKV